MAKRGRVSYVMGPEHRDKIKNSNVLTNLIKFAAGEIDPDLYPPHRVTASLGLLRKIMPDLSESTVNAIVEGEVIVTKIVTEIVDPKTKGR